MIDTTTTPRPVGRSRNARRTVTSPRRPTEEEPGAPSADASPPPACRVVCAIFRLGWVALLTVPGRYPTLGAVESGRLREDEQPEGTVYVGERFTDGPQGWASGRFDAHWESAEGSSMRWGPEDVSIDDALEWARAEADQVFVTTLTDEVYSAGVVEIEGTPAWPAGGLAFERRPTQDEWYARVAVDGSGLEGGSTTASTRASGRGDRERAEELCRALDGTDGVRDLAVSERRSGGWGVACTVEAPDAGHAVQLLEAVLAARASTTDRLRWGSVEASNHPL